MRITKSVVFGVNKCGGRFYVVWDNFDLLTWLCSGHYNGRSSSKRQAGHPWVFMSLPVLCSRAPEQWAVKTAPFLSPSNHDFTHLFFIAFELFFQNLCIIWILIKHVHGVEIKCNEGGDDSYSGTLRPDPPKHLKHSSSTTFTWIPVLCSSRPYFFLSGPS